MLISKVTSEIRSLGAGFFRMPWNFKPVLNDFPVSQWLSAPGEDIMVCAFVGNAIDEPFHRQDFFFLNFACSGDYEALSGTPTRRIRMQEGDCYIGQPGNGYALKKAGGSPAIIVGVHIKKETFFKEYMGALASDEAMFRFFLDARKNPASETSLRLTVPRTSPVWRIVEALVLDYVHRDEGTQRRLKPLTLALLLQLSHLVPARERPTESSVVDQMLQYLELHSETIGLKSLAARFGLHPVYVSTLLPRQTGKRFSDLLLDCRMRKARQLLENTALSVERIAETVGYRNTSSFYKAYRRAYGHPPRRG